MFGLKQYMSATIYTSDLTKDECLRRLQGHTGRSGWTRWAEGTISAKVRGDRFRLFAWGPVNLRNSFAPLFYGRLEEGIGETRIRGRFCMHPIVQAFLFVWFGGLVAGAGLMLFLPPSALGSGLRPSVFALLGPAGMGLLGLGLVRFGRWLARGQMESLRCFLARELKARPLIEGTPNQSLQATAAPPTC